ncbi:hypothetical protein V6R21_14285 [Limibacter armeniacum]|uniref:nuclear transport factor 2 family protein n=1 Tax=Limibacter armeniacum TaxID=466084 RepID=UPI002FE50020
MKNGSIVKSFLSALNEADYDGIMKLFAENASVSAPHYGEMTATRFAEALNGDTNLSNTTLLNVFENESGNTLAGHFEFEWELTNGENTKFECVGIFEIDGHKKVTALSIIFDTAKIPLDKIKVL